MEYCAGMVSQVFAFVETKKTAQLITQGLSKDEAREKIESENIFLFKIRESYCILV